MGKYFYKRNRKPMDAFINELNESGLSRELAIESLENVCSVCFYELEKLTDYHLSIQKSKDYNKRTNEVLHRLLDAQDELEYVKNEYFK